ncbi:hypothetical protein [Oceanirhabdus seepicola]|uniref:Zinc ribbon domain-containing protein n=1 Tax=Oceanirhabdus seepicola TaxID=2828781 RepID=A0A9J6NXF7_9CLOT|nr:hypothetical protein [Oceanirhabdus seepicola]MCM1989138.1 zinc ribbon domain-containing protein [Oceanirhabdus seepicola]
MNDNKDRELINMFKFRKIALICLYTSLLFLALSNFSLVFTVVGIGLIISFFILSSRYWKCPYCGKAFELRHSTMDGSDYCPSCGKKLK